MSNKSEYKKHYQQFSQNVAFAIRTWHHHVHLNNRANEDPLILAALQKSPRYWDDQRYIAVQTTIIFLGKIFDNDSRVYNVDKTLRAANDEKKHFSKSELRKRKVESGIQFEGIDKYLENVAELSNEDLKVIGLELKKAKAIWERVKPLRDQVYAHNQMLSKDEQKEIYEAVKNSDINQILQILLNISDALWQAEYNGRKPDFSIDKTEAIDRAKEDIEKLICSLLNS